MALLTRWTYSRVGTEEGQVKVILPVDKSDSREVFGESVDRGKAVYVNSFADQQRRCSSWYCTLLPLTSIGIFVLMLFASRFLQAQNIPNILWPGCFVWNHYNDSLNFASICVQSPMVNLVPLRASISAKEATIRILFTTSAISFIVIGTIFLTKVFAFCGGSEARVTDLELAINTLPWAMTQEIVEFALVCGAFTYGHVTLDLGLHCEVWILVFEWLISCHITEAFLVGNVSTLSVVMSATPLVSQRIGRLKDKVQIALCCTVGGSLGVSLAVASAIFNILPNLYIQCQLRAEAVALYFVVTRVIPGEESMLNATCMDRFQRKLLTMLQQATSKAQFVLALFNDLPLSVVSFLLLRRKGGSLFVYVSIVWKTIRVVLTPLLRIEVLRRQDQWTAANHLSLGIWHALWWLSSVIVGSHHQATLQCAYKYVYYLREVGHKEALVQSKTLWESCKLRKDDVDRLHLLAMHLHARCHFQSQSGEVDWTEVALLHHECWDLMRSKFGKDDPNTMECMRDYGGALRKSKEKQEALDVHRRCLELMRTRLGIQHQDTLASMCNVGSCLRDVGEFDKALETHRLCWELRCVFYGTYHNRTLNVAGSYAESLRAAGQKEAAADMYRQISNMKAFVLGESHSSTLEDLRNYARMLRELGNVVEADCLDRRNQELQRISGNESLCNLGAILCA